MVKRALLVLLALGITMSASSALAQIQPDVLELTMADAPDPVPVNGTLTYTLLVRNVSPVPALNVQVIDQLPTSVAFVSATMSCTYNGGTGRVTCALGTMGIGASVTITIVVTAPAAPQTLSNSAAATTSTSEANTFNNSAQAFTSVSAAPPTIATTASPGITIGGGQLTDTAVVSGRFNPQPGASIDFRLYGPDNATCSGAPIFSTLDVPYPVAGGSVASNAFTPTTAGTYRWRATYSGDANNVSVTGACDAANESAVVAQATPTIATMASPNITLGAGQLSDTATVSGRVNPQPGATIDFRLYGPIDATCSGPPAFLSLDVPYPPAGGTVTSAAFTPVAAGTYRWRAFYSGDVNNVPVSGACNATGENVDVLLPDPIFQNGFEGP